MDISVGLPNSVPGASGADLLTWARLAEEAGFASLSVGDRLVWPGTEPLLTLAAAAAATERIRLSLDVLIASARADVALLAAQTATLQHLSGGRLVLGVGAGGRSDDFEVSGTSFAGRGKRLDETLLALRSLWSSGTVGPALDQQPPVLIGGRTDAALERMARHGDGTVVVAPPAQFAARAAQARSVWEAARRDGQPKLVAYSYFALGSSAVELAEKQLLSYYAFMGPMASMFAGSALTSEDAVTAAVAAYQEAGADELVLVPCSSSPDQLTQLAKVVKDLG